MARCHLRLCLQSIEQLVWLELGVQAQTVIDVDGSLYVLTGIETQVLLLVVTAC